MTESPLVDGELLCRPWYDTNDEQHSYVFRRGLYVIYIVTSPEMENFTLVKKQSRLDVRKFSFSQRTINVLNKLSTECVHASSVNMFKNRIDKYLVKAGYT